MNRGLLPLNAWVFAFLVAAASQANDCQLQEMRTAALRGAPLPTSSSCFDRPSVASAAEARAGDSSTSSANGSPPAVPATPVSAREQIAAALRYELGSVEAIRSPGLKEAGLPTVSTAGGMGVVTEGVQILGQIVADRASNAAFVRARDLLLSELHCPALVTEKPSETKDAKGTKATPPSFPLTCATLRGVRLQDLAASRETLLLAFVTDIADQLHKKISVAGSPVLDRDVPLFREVLAGIGHSTTGRSDESAYLMSSGLISTARRLGLGSGLAATSLTEEATATGSAAWVVGVAAFLRCRTASSAGAFEGDVRECPADEYAERMLRDLKPGAADPSAVELALARQTAMRLLLIHGNSKSGDGNNPRTKLRAAVELGFDIACFQASEGLQLCNPSNDLAGAEAPAGAKADSRTIDGLSTLRALLLAAVEGDTNAVMREAALAIKLILPGDKKKVDQFYKVTRLLGTIADYSLTYTKPDGASQEELHAARTKVLQSLVDEMTYRSDRGGADIFSLGGALGLVGGVRMPFQGGGGLTPASPVSLRLGVGFDHVSEGNGPGFHFEASVVDLGQYVAWDGGQAQPVRVLEPAAEALLSPTIAVGMAWGRELPWVLSAIVNYAPSYRATGDTSGMGALSFGASLGIYVPLFDLN